MERMNLLFLGKMPDSYEWSDGDKDAIEDANEVWELAMQKDKRPTLYFGLKTSFLEELIFFFSFQLVRKAIIANFVRYF